MLEDTLEKYKPIAWFTLSADHPTERDIVDLYNQLIRRFDLDDYFRRGILLTEMQMHYLKMDINIRFCSDKDLEVYLGFKLQVIKNDIREKDNDE